MIWFIVTVAACLALASGGPMSPADREKLTKFVNHYKQQKDLYIEGPTGAFTEDIHIKPVSAVATTNPEVFKAKISATYENSERTTFDFTQGGEVEVRAKFPPEVAPEGVKVKVEAVLDIKGASIKWTVELDKSEKSKAIVTAGTKTLDSNTNKDKFNSLIDYTAGSLGPYIAKRLNVAEDSPFWDDCLTPPLNPDNPVNMLPDTRKAIEASLKRVKTAFASTTWENGASFTPDIKKLQGFGSDSSCCSFYDFEISPTNKLEFTAEFRATTSSQVRSQLYPAPLASEHPAVLMRVAAEITGKDKATLAAKIGRAHV